MKPISTKQSGNAVPSKKVSKRDFRGGGYNLRPMDAPGLGCSK